MFKNVFLCLLAYSTFTFANDDTALREVDSYRLPKGSVRVETLVKLYREGKLDKEKLYTVYIKSERRTLVLMKSSLEIGQKILMLKEKFWFLTPDSQRPLRITASQKLLGEASTGDIANMTWSDNYVVQKIEEISCPQFQIALDGVDAGVFKKSSSCLRLELASNVEGLTYSSISLFVDKNSKFPIRADLFVSSGKKAKEAWFAKLKSNNEKYIDTMILIDNIQSTRHTIVTYKSIDLFDCPDEYFNPASLARNALPGY